MVTNDMNFSNLSDDWSVILQSYSPKLKKELVKRISEIFELEKKDAEQAIANTPLILLDNLSFGMAARIKNYFQKLGAVVETTNHEMIKKNCFQVLWPETPDLSFFLKEETKPASHEPRPEAPARVPDEPAFPAENTPASQAREDAPGVVVRASQPTPEEEAVTPPPAKAEEGWEKYMKTPVAPQVPVAPDAPAANDGWETLAKAPEVPKAPKSEDGWEKLVKEPVMPKAPKAEDGWEKLMKGPVTPQAPKVHDGWEKRAKELSEKLEKFQQEKKKVNEDIVLKAVEKVKSDFGRKKEEGIKPGSDEDVKTDQAARTKVPESATPAADGMDWRSKAMLLSDRVSDLEHDLIDSKEALVKEIEMWRSKASSAEGHVRDLEANLVQKSQEMDRMAREKEDLSHKSAKARDLELQLETLHNSLAEKTNLVVEKDNRLAELQEQVKEWMEKLQANENAIKEHENSLASLRDQARDGAEKAQVAGNTIVEKDNIIESLQKDLETIQGREKELLKKTDLLERSVNAMEEDLRAREESLKARDEALAAFDNQVAELTATLRELEPVRQEHAQLAQERGTIRKEYDTKIAELEVRAAKTDDDHRRYRSRVDRKVAAATRELGEWVRGIEALRQGLQKLVIFMGSESAIPDSERKAPFRSPLSRPANSNGAGKP